MTALLFLLLFIMVIVLFNRINAITRKFEQVERELAALHKAATQAKSQPDSPLETKQAPQHTDQDISQALPTKPQPAAVSPPRAMPVQPQAAQIPVQEKPLPAKTLPRPSRPREEWEVLIGGKLLNRIGALALIIGAGFFLKYAFDNNWITETLRVMIGVLAGVGLLLAGERFQRKELKIFAQGLTGAGLSILYLSLYASFNFYHLVPQIVAFLLMSIVTIVAFLLAFRYDALAVSVMGWAGGFLTPILLSTGQANEAGLFTYIAILEAGLLAVVFRKDKWNILAPLTLGAIYFVFYQWFLAYYQEDDLLLTLFFVAVFWSLFFVLDVIRTMRAGADYSVLQRGIAALNAVFFYATVYLLLYPENFSKMAAVSLAISAVYFLTILLLKKKNPEAQSAFAQYTMTAIFLLILATAIEFSGFTIAIFWSIEAFLLAACTLRWQHKFLVYTALAIFLLTAFFLINVDGALAYEPIEAFTLIFNLRFLAFAVLALSLAASVLLSIKTNVAVSEQVIAAFRYGWCMTVLVLLTVETVDYFEKSTFLLQGDTSQPGASEAINRLHNLKHLTLSGTWLFYSIVLMAVGLWRRIQGLRLAAITLFGITILKVFLYDLSFLDTLYRIISFISLGAILLAVSFLYQKYRAAIFEKRV
jgi:uncharacterized membrane protein